MSRGINSDNTPGHGIEGPLSSREDSDPAYRLGAAHIADEFSAGSRDGGHAAGINPDGLPRPLSHLIFGGRIKPLWWLAAGFLSLALWYGIFRLLF